MKDRSGMRRREFLKVIGKTGSALALTGFMNIDPGFAEDVSFPAGKVTWIVGQPPGGGLDLTARGVAPFVEKYLKAMAADAGRVGVQIKTIEGGLEIRALNTVYHAKPDGYTISMATDKIHSGTILGELGFDLFELTYLARLGSASKVIVASNTSNLKTWDDVVKASKKSTLRLAIGGHGTSNHIAAIFLLDVTGLAAKIVQFKGTAGTNSALIRGDVQLLVNSEDSVKNMIDTKQLRPILTFSEDSIYPQVQNAGAVGFPELLESIKSQRYVVAPPRLPAAIKKILEEAMKKAVEDKEFIAWREKAGISYDPIIGGKLDKYVKDLHGFYKSREKLLREYILDKK